jgi:predicted deacylase
VESVVFGGISARPGQHQRGRVKALELSDGSWAEFPVMITNGVDDGPIVYLGAGIHGDEYNGIAVIQEVMRNLDPEKMAGAVIAVPIQNPIAHRSRGRLTLIVQTDETNMHRVWPGNPDTGDSAQRMAGILFTEITRSGASIAVDYHTGATGQLCAPHAFVPSGSGAAVEIADHANDLAEHLNLGYVMRALGGAYSNPLWMQHSLTEARVAALGTELGQGRLFQPEFIEMGVEGTLNMLRHAGVLKDAPARAAEAQPRLVDERWVRANRGGFVTTLIPWGQDVAEGDILGRTVDTFGEVVEELVAPAAGLLMNLRQEPAIATGERLCRIGIYA